MEPDKIQLAALVDATQPDTVLSEILKLAKETAPDLDPVYIERVFADIQALFAGRYPGYRACNTDYHDLQHTLDITLAMARLVHGAAVSGAVFSARTAKLGLLAALFHDTGYIQTEEDLSGTGARHTLTHVDRSVAFMMRYADRHGLPAEDVKALKHLIQATEINAKSDPADFGSPEIALAGQMLGTADLLGQMADRYYLEKLLFLYLEFTEGGVPGYVVEKDILEKTSHFYEFVKKRLDRELGGVYRFLTHHFRARFNLDMNLYLVTVDRNIAYLKEVVKTEDYRSRLRRGNIVKTLVERERGRDRR